ncbi:hypothetical protein HF896_12815 [Alicycliphilus denitrificans]|uniref:Uncharacterized protein n=2 Tax=Alicycliphilus denitrificans TaxID=179636 RepID=F4GAE8_ALIDK|nr:hypothetical protein [Alicycliphilus denitrificans]ADU99708.1 hypothetical protein Alide_1965 [Alicycliphilus denitrificans BC]AEB84587.1 hypothetical protein Alide2_2218 [Alicycliphilus denitrificans K601]QKD44454.1 hypothetical protein HF896_12815 [Alicycliphilus denitrificans]GAO23636.1 hypothetical protein ALISP_3456 [Alicycliphilus sp. B1]
MKTLIASALLLAAPAWALAQTAPQPAGKPAAQAEAKKSASKASTKPAAAKSAAAKSNKAAGEAHRAVAKASPTSSRTQLHSGAMQVAAGISAAETALTPQELAIAENVYTGRMACELGAFVEVEADAQSPGRFYVHGKGFRYHMSPVVSVTSAVRLEDQRAGAVWIQIANKSMLMNQKLGQRMADECMSPQQVTVAEAIRKNPPPSLLETPAAK